MKRWVVQEKRVGQTPLQVAEKFRKAEGLGDDVSIAYAGRLDPMASGKLLLLIGDECKKQKRYFGLDKAYDFEVLLGVSADTADPLGLITKTSSVRHPGVAQMKEVSKGLEGEQTFEYPRFSSKTVSGKPLHMWTLENRLHEIEIPTITSRIYSLKCIGVRTVSADELKKTIFEKINSFPEVVDPRKALGQDFRRSAVRDSWQKFFTQQPDAKFSVASFRSISSSGTYMRTLAEEIGRRVGVSALAFSIHRTHIGTYNPLFRVWLKQYR